MKTRIGIKLSSDLAKEKGVSEYGEEGKPGKETKE